MTSDGTDSEAPRSSALQAEPASNQNGATSLRRTGTDRDSVRAREKEAFGGIKFGSAFLGWLTTIGTTILLVAIVAAIATTIGLNTNVSGQDLRGVGIGVAIVLLVILFIAYFTGGYVAGRMARFNGVRQGLAVWLWAVLIAVVLTVIGLIAGQQSDLASQITSQVNLPAIPVSSSDLTAGGLIGLAIVLVATLVAAILGGLAGMRFHRRVDKAGFDISDAEKDESRRAEAADVRQDAGQRAHPPAHDHGHDHGAGSRTEAPRTDDQVPRQQG